MLFRSPGRVSEHWFQQESKQPWEVANNTTSERLDRLESSIKNVEVLLGQLANSNNSWEPEDLPNQEEVKFDLVEDISEHTKQPSFTDPIFHDYVTNDSMIDIIATKNIEESFKTCLVDNFKGDEEEADFDLMEDIEDYSFTDHVVQSDDTDETINEL